MYSAPSISTIDVMAPSSGVPTTADPAAVRCRSIGRCPFIFTWLACAVRSVIEHGILTRSKSGFERRNYPTSATSFVAVESGRTSQTLCSTPSRIDARRFGANVALPVKPAVGFTLPWAGVTLHPGLGVIRRDNRQSFTGCEGYAAAGGLCCVAFCRAVEAPPETPWTNAG